MEQSKLFEFHQGLTTLDKLRHSLDALLRYIPPEETTYGTHGLFPYVAKFMPQYPNVFIRFLTKKGDTVLDPMCGSGTTLIESVLLNRNALGIDIDPLAQKISKVATTPIEDSRLKILERDFISHLVARKNKITTEKYSFDWFPNYDIWFRKEVLADIFFIRDEAKTYLNDDDLLNLSQVALSRIVKEVSNADPRDIFPEINHEKPVNQDADVLKSFKNSLKTSVRKVRQFTKRYNENRATAKIIGSDARKIELPEESIDLIVTSPPYAYAMDYARIHKLVFFAVLGMSNEELLHLSRQYVGTDRVSTQTIMNDFEHIEFARDFIKRLMQERKVRAIALWKYLVDMREITAECTRVLKNGGHFVYVIGNATLRGREFSTADALKRIGESYGLSTVLTFERPYYARRMGKNRANHSAVTKADVFILFEKPK
jgi:DNA modification methylase